MIASLRGSDSQSIMLAEIASASAIINLNEVTASVNRSDDDPDGVRLGGTESRSEGP